VTDNQNGDPTLIPSNSTTLNSTQLLIGFRSGQTTLLPWIIGLIATAILLLIGLGIGTMVYGYGLAAAQKVMLGDGLAYSRSLHKILVPRGWKLTDGIPRYVRTLDGSLRRISTADPTTFL